MNPPEQASVVTVRVFISYSHDSREHCDRVLAFAQQLRRDGIEAELDQFHQDELLHWPRWCEEQLRPETSTYVVCVCTAEYRRRVENKVPADVGKGVFWEATLIYDYLYDEKGNRRCVPVLMGGANEDAIPRILSGWNRYELTTFRLNDGDPGYEGLSRLLTGRPKVKPEPVGEPITLLEKEVLPPLEIPERKTDFMGLIEEIHRKVAHIEQISIETKADTSEIKVGVDEIKAGIDEILATATATSTQERPHNLPLWMPPEYFVGRGEQLHALWEAFSAPGANALAVVQPHVVRGGGGIGKTRLAIQAVWALYLRGKCDMAFFVSASSPDELDTQLAALAAPSLFDLYKWQEPPRELAARRQNVIQALREKAGSWILLLDAADSEEARDAVNGLLKELAGGRFVITSRRDDWSKATVRKLLLELFTIEEARACLLSRYWKADRSADELAGFENVANELEFLPLALVLAASYMESRKITPLRYLKDFREKRDKLLDFSTKDVDYDRSLLAAFRLSYDQLQSPQRSLLHVLCWLAPEPFPRQLVEDSEAIRRLLAAGGGEDPKSVDAASVLGELQTLSLLELDEKSLRLHKLILECTAAVQDDQTRGLSFLFTLEWLAKSLPSTAFDVVGWAMWGRLGPHLDALIQTVERLGLEKSNVALICARYGLFLRIQGRCKNAQPLYERALAIREKNLGPEHTEVAASLYDLAVLTYDQAQYAKAEPLFQRTLAIQQRTLGSKHPDVTASLRGLALLYRDQGRYSEAEPLYQQALAIWENAFGPEHPDVARGLNGLAGLYKERGQYGKAEQFYKKALVIRQKLNPEHPYVAVSLTGLAGLYMSRGQYGSARELYEKALAILGKTLGLEHSFAAPSLNGLASVYMIQGQYEKARPLYEQALTIWEKAWGLEHPATVQSLYHIAELYRAQGQYGKAEPLFERALAIREKALGAEHPWVASCLNGLAGLYCDQGRYAEAEPLYRRALAIREKVLDPVHLELAITMEDYASALRKMDRQDEAALLQSRARIIRAHCCTK